MLFSLEYCEVVAIFFSTSPETQKSEGVKNTLLVCLVPSPVVLVSWEDEPKSLPPA